MSIKKMSHSQKKWFSCFVAVVCVSLVSMLTGCSNKEAAQAAAQQKATNEAAAVFMKQGDGKIRQWGQKPTSDSAKEAGDAKK